MASPDVTLITTEALVEEYVRRFPMGGCLAGLVAVTEETDQHRLQVWGSPVTVIGLTKLLEQMAIQEMESMAGGGIDAV